MDPEVLADMPDVVSGYFRFLKERVIFCSAEGAMLETPVEMLLAGRMFRFHGSRLEAMHADADGEIRLGVLGAIKDHSPETRAVLDSFLDKFAAQKVDAVVLLGDLAEFEDDMTRTLLAVAGRGFLTLVVIGNTEGRTEFNRAVLNALKATPHIVNMDQVQRVDLGGAVLLAQPGYRNKEFTYHKAGCTYTEEDIKRLYTLGMEDAGSPSGPLVLISHGPPQGDGPQALDRTPEWGNVGEPLLKKFIVQRKVAFGLFSHILEAGGRGENLAGRKVAPGKWSSSLFLNVGTANPMIWTMNDNSTSCGMAALVRIQGQKAKYSLFKNSCRQTAP